MFTLDRPQDEDDRVSLRGGASGGIRNWKG